MASHSFTIMFYVGFVIYIALLTGIGYLTSRKKNSGENFVTGGNSLMILPLIGTIGATMIGTGLSMGATANGYRFGWGGSIFAVGSTLGMLCVCLYTSARNYNFNTIAEEAQFYYGGNRALRSFVGIFATICEIIWVANAINGGAAYLSYVTGMGNAASKIICTLAFFAFTIFGGYLSVVWTDTIQFAIIIVGFLTIAVSSIPAAGGFANIQDAFIQAGNPGALGFYGLSSYGALAAFSLVVTAFSSPMCVQSFRQRIYTANNAKTARRGFITSAIMIFCFSFLPSIIGMSAFAITYNNGSLLENADYAFVYMAIQVMPALMGLFFIIAGVSATLSSADSNALAGTTLVLDEIVPLFKKGGVPRSEYKKYGRIVLTVISLFACILSLFALDIISFIANVAGAFCPAFAVCLFMGKMWKRATWQGGIASLLGGVILGLLYLMVPAVNTLLLTKFGGISIPSALIAIIAGIIVSLMTKRANISEKEVLKLVYESRNQD